MENIAELIKKINSLPNGYISKKVIHGNEYFYLQKLENNKIVSQYINQKDVDKIITEIKLRRALKKKLNKLVNSPKNLATLSKQSRELTGYIMCGDKISAKFDKRVLLSFNQLAPLAIQYHQNIHLFFKSRMIDDSRKNSRILKRMMNIHNETDEEIILKAYAATITDNYWFKPINSKLKYKDISFDNDLYSDVALKGEIIIYPKESKLSPELTLNGSYEKCWKIINNEWWMYKSENEYEIYSELVSSEIANLLNIPTVRYEKIDKYIRCRNFATKYNYEPLSSIMGNNENYDDVLTHLVNINNDIAKQFLSLLFFDAMVNNVDRHNENYGLLRDKKTGKIISLAPNFDNNLSLLAINKDLSIEPKNDGFISYFVKFIKNNEIAKKIYKEISLPNIEHKDILAITKKYQIDIDYSLIADYLYHRYIYLKNQICNL